MQWCHNPNSIHCIYILQNLKKTFNGLVEYFILKGPSGSLGLTQVPDDSSWRPVKIGWLKFSGSPKPLPSTLDAVTLHFRRCVRQLPSKIQKNTTQASEYLFYIWYLVDVFYAKRTKVKTWFLLPEGLSMVLKSEDGVGEWTSRRTTFFFFIVRCDSDGGTAEPVFSFQCVFARVLFFRPEVWSFVLMGKCVAVVAGYWNVRVSRGLVYTVHFPICSWSTKVVEGTSF